MKISNLKAGRKIAKVGKDKKFIPPINNIGYLTHEVARMRRTLLDKLFKPISLTRAQVLLIGQLHNLGNDASQQELADAMSTGKATIGTMINLLEKAGMIERKADASDKRSKRISITPEGYEAIETARSMARYANKATSIGIDPDEILVTERVLKRLKMNIASLLDEDGE